MVHDNRASTSSWNSDCLERRKVGCLYMGIELPKLITFHAINSRDKLRNEEYSRVADLPFQHTHFLNRFYFRGYSSLRVQLVTRKKYF